MEFYGLENYFSFSCMAGDCPSTCCAGWSILVDERDYHRFCQLEQRELREDILGHIRKRDGKYFFQNRSDGRCAMLDGDGLCRIQRNSSEEILCNTCRKYPRLFRERQGIFYFSLAASCPVVSRALWRGEMSYVHGEDSGIRHRINGEDLPISQPVWDFFRQQEDRVTLYRERIGRGELFWDSLGKLFDFLAEIIPELPLEEQKPWERLILFYAGIPEREMEEVCGDISEGEPEEILISFLQYDAEKWTNFTRIYLAYRFMSRQAMLEETVEETFCQSMGEVYLVQAACFLEFWRQGALPEEVICGWIQRMYRLCANGRERGIKCRNMFCDFYQEKSLWIPLLL